MTKPWHELAARTLAERMNLHNQDAAWLTSRCGGNVALATVVVRVAQQLGVDPVRFADDVLKPYQELRYS